MQTKVAMEAFRVVCRERENRRTALQSVDPEAAYDLWVFEDEPFMNELYLAILVGVRHQIERELIFLSARFAEGNCEYTQAQYNARVVDERNWLKKPLNQGGGWPRLEARLQLSAFPDWSASLEALRLIVNSNKHDPWASPEAALLNLVRLPLNAPYAPIAESHDFQEALATFLGLPPSSGYCEIASEFVGRAEVFIAAVGAQQIFARVKRGSASLNPDDFLR